LKEVWIFTIGLKQLIEIDLGKKYDINSTSKRSIMFTLNNIAENYKMIKEYEEALIYLQRAYNIDSHFDYSLSKGLTILSLGEIYYLLGDYEKANSLAFKALRYIIYYKYVLKEGDTYKLIAQTSWKKGDYANADKYFYIAMDLNEKESVPNYKVDALLSYYEYLKDQKKLTQALNISGCM